MSLFSSIEIANLYIPNIVKSANLYLLVNLSQKSQILSIYNESTEYQKALFFYIKLFAYPDVLLPFDDFNWIPLIHDEIIMLATYANTLDTWMKGKINLLINSQLVEYNP
jgi:hypothetical protein